MLDALETTDAELVEQVSALSPELGQRVQARLRRLRLGRVVGGAPVPEGAAPIGAQQPGPGSASSRAGR